jgi:glutamate formiminotransferase/formiminotetrahydrofolate cyclodeaminase
MTTPIVECIANYSEARRPEVVESIAEAVRSVQGAQVLDRHSDMDHNRTVITFAGPPEAVEEAAFRSIARAAELIDLNEHRGEHPRIGATDVVPFVPISEVSMDDCVAIARRLGQRVADELGIPVYLYEKAAVRPERTRLEVIRRGEYEALKEEIGTNPEREPDFGPNQVGPAGATVIGARSPLIAFNVYLTSDDQAIAKKIARAIRHSSGGLRHVKALGLLVDGRAQVSMNLTDFRSTPVARVVEVIRREAERYGVGIHHSELVGLIPQEALVDAAVWYMQLDQFERDQILERRLSTALKSGREEEPPNFLDALASSQPTPGGGSASAYSGAAAAALVAMVTRVTIGKKKYAQVEEEMHAIQAQAEKLRAELTRAVQQDAEAFDAVMDAFRMSKGSPEQEEVRRQAIQEATIIAAEVPLEVARKAVSVMALASQVIAHGNLNAISDGGAAAAMARAALTGAGYNVRINIGSLQDPSRAHDLMHELQDLERRAATLEGQIRSELQERGGMPLA